MKSATSALLVIGISGITGKDGHWEPVVREPITDPPAVIYSLIHPFDSWLRKMAYEKVHNYLSFVAFICDFSLTEFYFTRKHNLMNIYI